MNSNGFNHDRFATLINKVENRALTSLINRGYLLSDNFINILINIFECDRAFIGIVNAKYDSLFMDVLLKFSRCDENMMHRFCSFLNTIIRYKCSFETIVDFMISFPKINVFHDFIVKVNHDFKVIDTIILTRKHDAWNNFIYLICNETDIISKIVYDVKFMQHNFVKLICDRTLQIDNLTMCIGGDDFKCLQFNFMLNDINFDYREFIKYVNRGLNWTTIMNKLFSFKRTLKSMFIIDPSSSIAHKPR
ncbi:MAG: hypothetical protein LBR15_02160 [Methanobrevibacter sp.]|jgi:hypothetical protein|nr:hypothetical protein [Candidatus Methanovirga australis]